MDVVLEDRLRRFADVLPGALVALPATGAARYGLRLVAHELNTPGAPGFVNFLALSSAPGFPLARLSVVDPRTRVVEIARAAVMPILDYGICLAATVEAQAGDIEIWGDDSLLLAVVQHHEHLERHVDLVSGHVVPSDALGQRAEAVAPALVKSWRLLRGAGTLREREILFAR